MRGGGLGDGAGVAARAGDETVAAERNAPDRQTGLGVPREGGRFHRLGVFKATDRGAVGETGEGFVKVGGHDVTELAGRGGGILPGLAGGDGVVTVDQRGFSPA